MLMMPFTSNKVVGHDRCGRVEQLCATAPSVNRHAETDNDVGSVTRPWSGWPPNVMKRRRRRLGTVRSHGRWPRRDHPAAGRRVCDQGRLEVSAPGLTRASINAGTLSQFAALSHDRRATSVRDRGRLRDRPTRTAAHPACEITLRPSRWSPTSLDRQP